LGRLNQLRRLDIVKLRKRAGRAPCSSIEMLINLRPLSVSAIRKGEVIDTHYLSSSPDQFLQRIYLTGSLEKFTMPNLLISSILCLQLCKGKSFVLTGL
jgi:disease resistance protein RPM1